MGTAVSAIIAGLSKGGRKALVMWINMWLMVILSVGLIHLASNIVLAPSMFWVLFAWCVISIFGAIGFFIVFIVMVADQ